MEKSHQRLSMLEPAIYRIRILGHLDTNLSDYYGGMTIEQTNDLQYGSMTILTGRLGDQCALIGVLNSLHDRGYLILSVGYQLELSSCPCQECFGRLAAPVGQRVSEPADRHLPGTLL